MEETELQKEERAFREEELRRYREGPYRSRSRYYEEPKKTFWEKLDRRDDYVPARRNGIETEGEAIAAGLLINFFGWALFLCFIALLANGA